MKGIHAIKMIKRLGAFLIGAVILAGSTIVAHAEGTYTYCYDYWGDVQFSPDPYEVANVFTANEHGMDKAFNNPSGLTVYGKKIFLCDTGNNRIIELERINREEIKVIRIIDTLKGKTQQKSFNNPSDFQIDEEGNYYVADTGNGRVVKFDQDLNYIGEFEKPDDNTLSADLKFQPTKLCVDSAGRVYCIAVGINKGLIKYENDGTFSGFVGATPVVFDFTDYIWKRIASQEQREKMESFVPTEYDNVYMDHDGFIYACSANLEEEAVKSGDADVVRRLNLMGSDILIRNWEYGVIGDLYMGDGGGHEGPSQITDVTAFDNDVYVLLDKNRGRLFFYDSQGCMVYAFGSNGNMNGYFRLPSAIDHMGYDIFVLDAQDKSITLFTTTKYGNMIFDAIDQFDAGEYTRSGELWNEILGLNSNYDLAYIGVGRSLLRQEKYKEAMEYFELKYDADNYSKAYKQYRKIWVEEHILIIFIVVFALLLIPLVVGKVKSIRHEIDNADIFRF